MTLTSFFYLLLGRRVGLRTARLAQESVGSDQKVNAGKLIKMLVFFTAVMELLGALVLSLYFVPEFGRYGGFMAAFFAISAFCNAGFDLLGMRGAFSSLASVNGQPLVMLTITALIICGGLGFCGLAGPLELPPPEAPVPSHQNRPGLHRGADPGRNAAVSDSGVEKPQDPGQYALLAEASGTPCSRP